MEVRMKIRSMCPPQYLSVSTLELQPLKLLT
jgi:hypothetical protein